MDLAKISAAIEAIQQSHPENLMARHFDKQYFASLEQPAQGQLASIIATGIENPDSQMGAYAMSPDDYDQFKPLLDAMIRDFHGIEKSVPVLQMHDWDTTVSHCDLSAIDDRLNQVSMRVRVARNLSTFPLPGAMSREQRVEMELLVASALKMLIDDPEYGGLYLSITPGSPNEVDATEYERRIAAHQMFKDMSGDRFLNAAGISADWPYGRGMYVSQAEDFLIWIGEEDHLRVMAMQTGGNLNALFDRLHTGLERLEDLLPPFATSPTYGNVTSCPTNLGAGMRASLHLKLPKLTSNSKELDSLKDEADRLGLAIRGAGGEHSEAGQDGLVDVSPKARLGVTEMEIMQRLYEGAAALWKQETSR